MLLLTYLTAVADACSCAAVGFNESFYGSDKGGTPLSLAKVLGGYVVGGNVKDINETVGGGQLITLPTERVYFLKVTKAFTGCARTEPFFTVARTPYLGSFCGVALRENSTYLLPLKQQGESNINLCQMVMEESQLSAEKHAFLDSRRLCCDGKCRCAGSAPLTTCPASVCEGQSPPCADAVKCVSNPCDGCRAEWFTRVDDMPACSKSQFPRRPPMS